MNTGVSLAHDQPAGGHRGSGPTLVFEVGARVGSSSKFFLLGDWASPISKALQHTPINAIECSRFHPRSANAEQFWCTTQAHPANDAPV